MARHQPGRRRGGQPGNKNALRHGIYSICFSAAEELKLKDSSIEDEQQLARKMVLYLVQLLDFQNHSISKLELSIVDRINQYLITINTIERTRLLAKGKGGELGQTIWGALMGRDPNNDKE
jgi:hypothetical protein